MYYPEDLFEEILRGPQAEDLLTLENALAVSVHAVVVIAESAGALCELGAFANHPALREKLVVVVHRKYRRRRSFVMLGPVRYLERHTRSSVVYWDWPSQDPEHLAEEVLRHVRRLAKETGPTRSLSNPIVSELFLLAFVFVAEPTTRQNIVSAVTYGFSPPAGDAELVAKSAVAALTRRKELTRTEAGYCVSEAGIRRLRGVLRSTWRESLVTATFDDLRVAKLNSALRKRQRGPRVGGSASWLSPV
ncbi:MAG: hypothetical protein FJX75_22840 [Armatimonadetes bacterium]|nr:hypothetical protein [Armatimonadota bacterium]